MGERLVFGTLILFAFSELDISSLYYFSSPEFSCNVNVQRRRQVMQKKNIHNRKSPKQHKPRQWKGIDYSILENVKTKLTRTGWNKHVYGEI